MRKYINWATVSGILLLLGGVVIMPHLLIQGIASLALVFTGLHCLLVGRLKVEVEETTQKVKVNRPFENGPTEED